MKYVMLETPEGQKIPIVFPDCLTHAHVAGAMQLVVDTLDPRKDLRPKQLEDMLKRGTAKPVSAGFVDIGLASVNGESESLDSLKSVPCDGFRIMLGDTVSFLPDFMVVPIGAEVLNRTQEKICGR